MKLRKWKKTVAVLGAAVMMTVSLGGCQSKNNTSYKDLDADAVLLTVGDETVSLKEAFFLIKWQQARYQTYLSGQYGEKWYESDLFGTGQSFQDYYKDYTIDILERICLAKQKMKDYKVELTADEKQEIEDTADTFMKENSKAAETAMMVDDKNVIIDMLTGYKILEKVTAKAVEGVNQEISDQEIHDEAYTKTYSYVYTSLQKAGTDGTTTAMSAEEKQAAVDKLNQVRTEVQAGKEFDAAVSGQGLEVASHTYNPGDDEDQLVEINNVIDKLQIGDVSEVIPLDTTGIFIGRLDSDNTDELGNEDVIKTAKESIIKDRKYDMFKGILETWRKDVTIKLDEDLWGKVTMKDELTALSKESSSEQ